MATAKTISIPSFDFSGYYYPEILRSLIQYQRTFVPEITDESDEEPFQQLLRAYALVGHLNNVLLDIAANESLLPTARLLESVRGHLALMDYTLKQNTPASVEVVLELSKVFTTAIELVPQDSQFSTVETEGNPQIIFETPDSFTIEPTDKPTAIFNFNPGVIQVLNNTFNAGDKVTVRGVDFRFGIEWAAGGSIAATLDNIAASINASANDAIKNLVYAISDGISKVILIPLDKDLQSIVISETDNATNNFAVTSGGFSTNKVGLATTDGLTFDLFPNGPNKGDLIYILHSNVMWDTLDWVFDTFGSGIEFAIEYFDSSLEDTKPDSVTNLGSNLRFDLTDLLGSEDRNGAVVRVVLASTGAQETRVSKFVSGKNVIDTIGLLGQSSVSVNAQDYIVGTYWNEVSDLTDATSGFTEDGKMSFTLPQSQSENWRPTTVNNIEGYAMRLRVVNVTSPVNPVVDGLRIDTGKQFVMVEVVQGQTVAEEPLGSSNGVPDQEFLLTNKPLIEGSLVLEINEGSGFQPWNLKKNFLSSNSASKDYTLDIKANDDATVKLGNGIQGKIPTPGVDNLRALYRIGADVNGNVGARTITVNKAGISFVNRVFNPRQAIGWAIKEGATETDLARLKIEGPASLRVLGRAITTDDMEFLATQFVDSNGSKLVARAKAIEETFGVKTVELVVVGFGGVLLTELQREELRDYFNGNKVKDIKPIMLANHELTPVNYSPNLISAALTVVGGNAEEIKNAVTALLNPEATFDDGVTKRWQFGQAVPLSVIVATAFEVDPVNIKKVTVTSPQAVGDEIPMDTRELPLADVITVTVI